jgi:exonuclease III
MRILFIILAFIFVSGLNPSIAYNDTECNVGSMYNCNFRQKYQGLPQNTVTTNRVRLMQYNVEWLFTNIYNGCPGDGCTWANDTEAMTHIKYVRNVFDEIKPDILNLCEVEGCDELNMLINDDYSYSPYLIFGKDTSTGQNVGLISNIIPANPLVRNEDRVTYPVPGSKCGYTGTGSEGVSKHYYTQFVLGNTKVHVIGLHLLAMPDDIQRCSQREAQAQVIQNWVVELMTTYPDDEWIIMGDLNDFDGEVLDMNSNKPISLVLDILKGKSGEHAGVYTLETVASLVPQSERYTEWWDRNGDCVSTKNEFSMIDHILLSHNLMIKVSNVVFYHGYPEYCGTYNSDHSPIYVDFSFDS